MKLTTNQKLDIKIGWRGDKIIELNSELKKELVLNPSNKEKINTLRKNLYYNTRRLKILNVRRIPTNTIQKKDKVEALTLKLANALAPKPIYPISVKKIRSSLRYYVKKSGVIKILENPTEILKVNKKIGELKLALESILKIKKSLWYYIKKSEVPEISKNRVKMVKVNKKIRELKLKLKIKLLPEGSSRKEINQTRSCLRHYTTATKMSETEIEIRH